MDSIKVYQLLTEAIGYNGKKHYKSCTKEEFASIQSENETIYFDVSKTYARSASISDWKDADPEDVTIAWETANFTTRQKQALDDAINKYRAANPFKTITNHLIITMVERIKKGESPITSVTG